MKDSLSEALKQMPQVEPPEQLWHKIQARLNHPKRTVHWSLPTSLVATLLVAALIAVDQTDVLRPANPEPPLNDLVNEIAIIEFNLINTPRINRRESTAERYLVSHINVIDKNLANSNQLDVRRQRELMQQKRVLMRNYQLLQVQRDAKLARVAYY